MKAFLSRRYHFSASHRLSSPELSEEENRAAFGKCANPHGHGHNYMVEVTVGGPVDASTGMVCDLAVLDGAVKAEVLDIFDQSNLNTHAAFASLVPTTENFCIEIYNRLVCALPGVLLDQVRIEETSNNSFDYSDHSTKYL